MHLSGCAIGHVLRKPRYGRGAVCAGDQAAQVDQLDDDVKQVLLSVGEEGEHLVQAFTASGRDESNACGSAMRLLRDRTRLIRLRKE